MSESFKYDNNIFNNRITFLLGLRAKPEKLEILRTKHIGENIDEFSIPDK